MGASQQRQDLTPTAGRCQRRPDPSGSTGLQRVCERSDLQLEQDDDLRVTRAAPGLHHTYPLGVRLRQNTKARHDDHQDAGADCGQCGCRLPIYIGSGDTMAGHLIAR